MTVMATFAWKSNAELIEDVARLGYLRKEWKTLDATCGLLTFWKNWRPDELWLNDANVEKGNFGYDFRCFPELWRRDFDAVVFDPPYKLNGTPSATDERYGVDVVRTWQQRHALILDGIAECARVCKTMLLIKCQDQVVSGAVRWQTRLFADAAEDQGFTLIDRLDMFSYRAQPEGTRQVHARRNTSTLLVLRRWQ